MRLTSLLVAVIVSLPVLAADRKPFPFTSLQFVKMYNTKTSENMKNALQIDELWPPDGVHQWIKFNIDRNLYMEIDVEFTNTKNRRINRVEIYTKTRGGEMWGEVDRDWCLYTIQRLLHPNRPKEKVVEIISNGLERKTGNKSAFEFDGYRYTKIGKVDTRRSTYIIERI